MYNQLSCVGTTVVISVQKTAVIEGEYLVRFDEGDAIFDVRLTKMQLQKLNNVLRSVCYPRFNEEKVKVCLNATASKSALENLQSEGVTSVATMATFLKSLRVEDVELGGTLFASENTSPATTS